MGGVNSAKSGLCVFELRFENRDSIERAYGIVSDDPWVSSCLVESESLRIRLTTTQADGAPLIERIYEHGGLVWCKRYPLLGEPGDAI